MWKLEASERIARWREFRKSLNSLPLDESLSRVVEFWNGCPFTPYYLDPDTPENWPDPWTLVEENYYCDLAKALGIVYTIYFTSHKNLSPEIRVYYDPTSKLTYNLVWIDQGKYVLNLIGGEVVNKTQIPKDLKLVKTLTASDMSLEKLQ